MITNVVRFWHLHLRPTTFDDILDATVESIPANSENVEVTQTFTYHGSVIHSSTNCDLEVN